MINYDEYFEKMFRLNEQNMLNTQENTKNIAMINAKYDRVMGLLDGISKTTNTLSESISDITGRLDILEEQEECTTMQIEKIHETANRRMREILGNPGTKDYVRYSSTFFSRLWKDAKRNGVGYKVAMTRKCDFNRAIEYIEAWTPYKGISHLKREVDERAKNVREAKILGYPA